jgi:hypothetical protein
MRRKDLVELGLLRIGRDGKRYPARWSRKTDRSHYSAREVMALVKLAAPTPEPPREKYIAVALSTGNVNNVLEVIL